MKESSRFKQLREISPATLLEETSHLRLIWHAVIAVTALLVALIIWSGFTTIKETANTVGELVPKGQVQAVQHLEGGIVTNVLVQNGQLVKRGQLLIKFDPTATQAELQQLQSREIGLLLNSLRLNAFLNNQSANIVKWGDAVVESKYNPVKNRGKINTILEDERKHLISQFKKREDQRATLETTILRLQEKLHQVAEQRKVWAKHLELLSKEFNMYHTLREKNLIAHKDYLTVLRDLNKSQGEAVRLESQYQQVKQEIAESENKLKELDSDTREQALKELGTVNDQLLEVRHQIAKTQAKLSRMSIRSPVTGTVKGIRVFAGNVIQPGGLLMEIVPAGDELMAETRVEPKDIGFIKVGDPVDVKILTYDFARYGSIQGKLTEISASTFLDKDGKPFYKATITLSQQHVGRGQTKNRLIAGMTVEASIITGEKTLLQYLLKPIHTTAKYAFTER